MRIKIPEFSTRKELFNYLKSNSSELIAQKKAMPITAEPVSFPVNSLPTTKTVDTKANEPVIEDVSELKVRVVANTANWMDSHADVLLPDAAKKSIEERKPFIHHLHDHIHRIDAKIGEVEDILLQQLTYSELGISQFGTGSTQAIVFITNVIKSFNPQIFEQYKAGKVNQHSIGLQYVSLSLALNDEDFKEEFATWEEFYPQIINKELADKKGFFWAVREIKLMENSAVLFGSNEVTPTLDNNLDKTKNFGPSDDTQNEPPTGTRRRITKLIH